MTQVRSKPARKLRPRLAWSGLAVFVVAALVAGFYLLHKKKSGPEPIYLTVDTPNNGSLPLFGRPSVSPDGESILFAVTGPVSRNPVWYLHSLATRTSSPLLEDGATTAVYWSFDSQSILISRSNVFWEMDLKSHTQQRLPVVGAYTSWQPEGIVTGGRSGLRWFRPDGSGARWLKKRDEKDGISYSYPSLIPGGRWLMYNASHSDGAAPAGFSLHFASLDGKVDRQILTIEHAAIYAGPGYVLFLRGDTLTAQAIDPADGLLQGDPAAIAGPVATTAGITDQLGSFSASNNGVLAFRSGAAPAGQEPTNRFRVIVNWPSLLKKK